jgi:hypothetical protein
MYSCMELLYMFGIELVLAGTYFSVKSLQKLVLIISEVQYTFHLYWKD